MFYSGIEKLDELLGEVDEGRIILVETVGGLGIGVAMSFVKEALKTGHNVFLVVSEGRERDIKEILKDWMDNVTILKPGDSFTLQELYTISLITGQREEKFGLFKILQPLLILHEPQKVYKLFREIAENLRKSKTTVVFTIDKKLIDDKILAMFEEEADFVIEIEEIIEGLRIKRGIRVKKSTTMPSSNFYELKINKDSVHIGERID